MRSLYLCKAVIVQCLRSIVYVSTRNSILTTIRVHRQAKRTASVASARSGNLARCYLSHSGNKTTSRADISMYPFLQVLLRGHRSSRPRWPNSSCVSSPCPSFLFPLSSLPIFPASHTLGMQRAIKRTQTICRPNENGDEAWVDREKR